MKSVLKKVVQTAQADVYSYRLIMVDNTLPSKLVKEVQAPGKRVNYVSVIATIRDPIFHAREKEYQMVFKSCLAEYARFNRTIRGDQLLSNLAYASKSFGNRVQFRLEALVTNCN